MSFALVPLQPTQPDENVFVPESNNSIDSGVSGEKNSFRDAPEWRIEDRFRQVFDNFSSGGTKKVGVKDSDLEAPTRSRIGGFNLNPDREKYQVVEYVEKRFPILVRKILIPDKKAQEDPKIFNSILILIANISLLFLYFQSYDAFTFLEFSAYINWTAVLVFKLMFARFVSFDSLENQPFVACAVCYESAADRLYE